jgi:hypothetical protein
MTLVFLLEERSTKELLDILLPQIIPENIPFVTIPHEGKTDLQKSIPRKLKGWNIPDTRFIIIQDQDSNDCVALKEEIEALCKGSGKPVLIRIACHEMEAWYFGDLMALGEAYGVNLAGLGAKRKYRNPDEIVNPKQELRKLISRHEQILGAKTVGVYMDIQRNSSRSFQVLVEGIRTLMAAPEEYKR